LDWTALAKLELAPTLRIPSLIFLDNVREEERSQTLTSPKIFVNQLLKNRAQESNILLVLIKSLLKLDGL